MSYWPFPSPYQAQAPPANCCCPAPVSVDIGMTIPLAAPAGSAVSAGPMSQLAFETRASNAFRTIAQSRQTYMDYVRSGQ